MGTRQNDKPWKAKTWTDVVCVDVKYKDRDRSIPEINIWRRTPAGKSLVTDPDIFPSYFYIPKTEEWRIATLDPNLQPANIEYPTYNSIEGHEMIRLNYYQLTKHEFMAARGHFEKTWEADVKYRTRYHIDNNIQFSLDRRICFFDIETDMSLDTMNTPAPILSIAVYDSLSKEFGQFILDRSLKVRHKQEEKDGVFIAAFASESDMLNSFIYYIQTFNPDILCAYNLYEFDWPYLINRMKVCGVNYRGLSEINDVYVIVNEKDDSANIFHCGGRELIDWYILVKKLYDEDKPDSFKLDDVALKILGRQKTKHKYNNLKDLYDNDKDLFMIYNTEDVRILRDLEDKTGLILKYMTALQQLVPIPMEMLKDNSVAVDCYILKTFNGKTIFPSKLFTEKKYEDDGKSKYTGAITGRFIEDEKGNIKSTDPFKKMYTNVGVFDFAGLYPNIVRTFNISPETKCIPGEPDSVVIDGVAFSTMGKGIFPTLIDNVITLRESYQKILKGMDPNDPNYNLYFNLATAVKKLNNSIYGVSGFKKFRLYDIDVAKSITAFGQLLIKTVYKTLKHELGYDVIYSDTDSCFFVLKSDVNDRESFERELEFLEKYINEKVVSLVDSYSVQKNYLFMDFEKRYTKLIFFGVKKRYIGVADYWKGVWLTKQKLVIKGYDLVRSEMALPLKDVIKKIIMMFLDGSQKEPIREFYVESVKKIRTLSVHDIAWAKGIGKNVDDYQKTMPQHIKACIAAEQHLGITFKKNDRPKLMYVKDLPYEREGKLEKADVIAFEKDTILPATILQKIDYDRLIQSFIVNKLDDFVGVEGMEMQFVLEGKKTTLHDFFSVRDDILDKWSNITKEIPDVEIVEDSDE